MLKIKTHNLLWILQISLFLVACEAPHRNPLDPANPNAEYCQLSGVIYSGSGNNLPLESATVIWRNQGRVVLSGENGAWELTNIPPDDGWLVFSAIGFESDSTWVEWSNTADYSIDIHMIPAPGISGTVSSAAGKTPLSGVLISWGPANQYTLSDSLGHYSITINSVTNGWLVFSRTGFVTDSVFVTWGSDAQMIQNIEMEPLQETRLAGHIHADFGNSAPLAGVQVTWPNDGRFAETDVEGNFDFRGITNKNGWLYFHKSGYKPDSLFVTWTADQSQQWVSYALNGIPGLIDFQIYSLVEFDYPNRKTLEINVSASFEDDERDSESVFITNAEIGEQIPLDYNPQTKVWEKRLYSSHFPQVNSLRDLVGFDFLLKVTDSDGDTITLGTERIERFVLDEIEIVKPLGGASVTTTPELQWQPFFPGFEFSYTVEIYVDDYFNRELIYQRNFVPGTQFVHAVETNLAAGKYFWVIWCVDPFDNRARSKPATFTVME